MPFARATMPGLPSWKAQPKVVCTDDYAGPSIMEGVEGIGIQLLNEDGSRSFASIFWHDYHLYITEATTPPGMPPPILFSAALSFLDELGLRVSYDAPYTPLFPVPPRRR